MAPFLNLAALTGEELELLLGVEAAQRLRPDLSRARMEQKAFRGAEIPDELRFEPLSGSSEDGRAWGATSDHTRKIRSMREAYAALGFAEHGAFYAPGLQGARHQLALTGEGDTAARIVWSETLSEHSETPSTQLLTLLRDRASGFAAVLTSTVLTLPAPSLSEEVALRHLPGLDVQAAHAAHRSEVQRDGRGVRLATYTDWERAWRFLRSLNMSAWARRGVLLDVKGEK
ncbi:hypothetical protein [Deinococcus peraridilitoris]|uniref:hypothetical protein n=1 Tax=Deinococcus peraridilitoris TaxID=432329 RepID=UPI0002E9CB01|nr:hypothetical protein [Deinococcus peraridilitoris]